MTIVIILVGIISLGVWAFIRYGAVFGGRYKGGSLKKIQTSPQYNAGRFCNSYDAPSSKVRFSSFLRFLTDRSNVPRDRLPLVKLPKQYFDKVQVSGDRGIIATWFGHSAMLLEVAGKRVFFDPMLGSVAGPLSWFGVKRYGAGLPLATDSLGRIDVVVVSHDHYDHLDHGTITQIKDRVSTFVVPLGVGAHLLRWGVAPNKIVELDWWAKTKIGDLTITSTPSQHFSGRKFGDSNATLWSSWVVQGNDQNVFFSGDSGYNPEIFKSIGQKFGGFDFAMIECGQYDDQWPGVHMKPEQTVQVIKDIGAKLTMPIHWSSFRLAMHQWDDPVERFTRSAIENGLKFVTPRIGESVVPGKHEPRERWWEMVQ